MLALNYIESHNEFVPVGVAEVVALCQSNVFKAVRSSIARRLSFDCRLPVSRIQ